jgi:hypothetical protein
MPPADRSTSRADRTAGELVGYGVRALDGGIREVDGAVDSWSRNGPQRSTQVEGHAVFRYRLVDIAGRDVDVIERRVPLRTDETVVVDTGEAWRIVSVLGKSATVARSE